MEVLLHREPYLARGTIVMTGVARRRFVLERMKPPLPLAEPEEGLGRAARESDRLAGLSMLRAMFDLTRSNRPSSTPGTGICVR